MRRSPAILAAALSLVVVGCSVVQTHRKRAADLRKIKLQIKATMNGGQLAEGASAGAGAAVAPSRAEAKASGPTKKPTVGAIRLAGTGGDLVQVNDQQTNFQTLMLNIDNPDVDNGRKREFNQYMSFWEKKRKQKQLGPENVGYTTPVFHDPPLLKKLVPKYSPSKGPLTPSRCFQQGKCDVLGDMAQHGDWKVNAEYCGEAATQQEDYNRYMCTKKNETWVPRNPACGKLCGYSPQEACAVLSRSAEVIIAGDSLMRQLYQGMSCIVSNDYKHCALKKLLWSALEEKADPLLDKRKWCKGKDVLWCSYTNTLELSSKDLDGNPCDGKVSVQYNASPSRATKAHAEYVIYMLNKLRPTDTLIFGAGLWGGLDADAYINNFLIPILDRATDPNWKDRTPLLVWVPPHTTFYPRPASKIDPYHLFEFNKRTSHIVRSRGVPVFETLNLGLDVPYESYDGLHFVGAVNLHKASLLLRFLESLHIARAAERR